MELLTRKYDAVKQDLLKSTLIAGVTGSQECWEVTLINPASSSGIGALTAANVNKVNC